MPTSPMAAVPSPHAWHRDRGLGVGAGEGEAAEAGFGEVFGEAEVGDFGEDGVGRGGEEDVLRLQIAMDDALLVREGEALEDPGG